MAEKRSISAREALADIRVGMTDDQLMAKYRLTDKGLWSLKSKLLAAGLVAQAQFDKLSSIQAPQENDTKVLARKIADAVKAGWSNEEIARTFGLLADKLPNVFPLLIKHGYLTQEDYDRRHSRLEDIIDIELDFAPTPANIDVPVDRSPFAVIRGRTLLASLLLATIATFIIGGIVGVVWKIKGSSPLGIFLSIILVEFFLFLCMTYLLHITRLSPTALLGSHPAWSTLRNSMLIAFPVIGFSIAGTYLLYLPLSYFIPGFVKWSLLDNPLSTIICTGNDECIFLNIMNFIVIVLIAPVVEEFFFRGLLLTRWSVKWNVKRGIFASSLVFALLHPANFVGAFFLGYVLCILYVRTKSLFVPIGLHMTNNALAWGITGVSILMDEPYSRMTLAEWQSFWWAALLTGLIVAPWVIWFTKRHFPKPDWRVPYVALQEGT